MNLFDIIMGGVRPFDVESHLVREVDPDIYNVEASTKKIEEYLGFIINENQREV